jgi:hypothetical protein
MAVLESAGECVASGQARSALWLLGLAFAVSMMTLGTGYLHRCTPGSSSLTSHRPLTGHLAVAGSKPNILPMKGVRGDDPVNSRIPTEGSSEPPCKRASLVGTIAILLLLAILIPMAFAGTSAEVKKISSAQEGDLAPIWITYNLTTTTWLPAVTVTAPPVLGPPPTPIGSTDVTAAETD